MATKSNNTSNEERRDKKIPVTCLTCKHSGLHRYDSNPILAACHKKPQPDNDRFPFAVDVVSTLRLCNDYDKAVGEKTIEQRFKHCVA